jgi:hypothetical protein
MLLIVTWPNRDPIFSALRLMFVAMSHDRSIGVVSLSTVCRPDVVDGKDCFELALQILGALRDASWGRWGTQLNNCSVSDRLFDFLPLSPPDVFPVDLYSSDTFPFPHPLLWPNAWILTSELFNLMLNHLKHNKIPFVHIPGSSSVLVTGPGQTITWWKIVAALPLRSCLIWFHTRFRQKIVTLINWLSSFVTRKSREWSGAVHDVSQDIRLMDSI